jgi:hypothetical protein
MIYTYYNSVVVQASGQSAHQELWTHLSINYYISARGTHAQTTRRCVLPPTCMCMHIYSYIHPACELGDTHWGYLRVRGEYQGVSTPDHDRYRSSKHHFDGLVLRLARLDALAPGICIATTHCHVTTVYRSATFS